MTDNQFLFKWANKESHQILISFILYSPKNLQLHLLLLLFCLFLLYLKLTKKDGLILVASTKQKDLPGMDDELTLERSDLIPAKQHWGGWLLTL